MQALTTRYRGPTDSNGSRIVVRSETHRVTVSWNHALNVQENHAAAARYALARWSWIGKWALGSLPDTTGYAVVWYAPAKRVEVTL